MMFPQNNPLAGAGIGSLPNAQHSARTLAQLGRNGDSTVAHLTPGEMVIPKSAQSPVVMTALAQTLREKGIDPQQYMVGSPSNSVNPQTGIPEFADYYGYLTPDQAQTFATAQPQGGAQGGGGMGGIASLLPSPIGFDFNTGNVGLSKFYGGDTPGMLDWLSSGADKVGSWASNLFSGVGSTGSAAQAAGFGSAVGGEFAGAAAPFLGNMSSAASAAQAGFGTAAGGEFAGIGASGALEGAASGIGAYAGPAGAALVAALIGSHVLGKKDRKNARRAKTKFYGDDYIRRFNEGYIGDGLTSPHGGDYKGDLNYAYSLLNADLNSYAGVNTGALTDAGRQNARETLYRTKLTELSGPQQVLPGGEGGAEWGYFDPINERWDINRPTGYGSPAYHAALDKVARKYAGLDAVPAAPVSNSSLPVYNDGGIMNIQPTAMVPISMKNHDPERFAAWGIGSLG